MGVPNSNTTVPTQTPVKTSREYALQSMALTNEITRTERLIQSVFGNPDLLLALAPVGFNETELNNGLALSRAAHEKFTARQKALAHSAEAKVARDQVLFSVQDEFSIYRQIVLANYREEDRAKLGASGKTPVDIERFLTSIRSAYTTAQEAPYVEVLSQCGFTKERICSALKFADELAVADRACKIALNAAQAAAQSRDMAADSLQTWMMKFRKIVHSTLKDRPELLALLQE